MNPTIDSQSSLSSNEQRTSITPSAEDPTGPQRHKTQVLRCNQPMNECICLHQTICVALPCLDQRKPNLVYRRSTRHRKTRKKVDKKSKKKQRSFVRNLFENNLSHESKRDPQNATAPTTVIVISERNDPTWTMEAHCYFGHHERALKIWSRPVQYFPSSKHSEHPRRALQRLHIATKNSG